MQELLNSLTRLMPRLGYVLGRVTYSGGTPSITSSGNALSDQTQVTVADTATGIATISVANFGDGFDTVLGFGTATVQDTLVATSVGTFSGTTASVIFNVTTAGTLADANFNFLIVGFPTT
jgi:hypothetical protein